MEEYRKNIGGIKEERKLRLTKTALGTGKRWLSWKKIYNSCEILFVLYKIVLLHAAC